jgi:phosphoribosyl-ATP pyrophosphohydrolase
MRKKEILAWAESRNLLHKENSFKQYTKLQEESNELLIAMLNNDEAEIVDAIGDCVVVLTILAEQLGLDIDVCTEIAYQVIKNRTGKTINGTFIKD